MPTPSRPPLPTFLIIGAQKSGTRWLRSNLGLHPDVYTARVELDFFNYTKNFHGRGVDWYREQFRASNGESAVGEATPGYMLWRHEPKRVSKRIVDLLPEVRLVAVLRNPIDRAYSAMLHHIRRGRLPYDSTLLEVVRRHALEDERLNLVTGGWYAESLRWYKARFGDQLLVVLNDDIALDPARVYRRVLRHIGVDDAFAPEALGEVVFSNRDRMRAPVAPLSDEDRSAMWEFFRSDVHRLQRMFDLDLSGWLPNGAEWGEEDLERVLLLAAEWDRASSWIGEVIDNVAPQQLDLAMPYREKTVGEAMESIVRGGRELAAAIASGGPEGGAGGIALDVPDTDSTPGSYRSVAQAVQEVVDTWGPDTHSPPVALTILGQVVTAWEIALVTEQEATVPADIAAITERPARDLMSSGSDVPGPLQVFIERAV